VINIRQAQKDEVEKLQSLDNEVFIADYQYDPDLNMDWAKSEKGKQYFSNLLKDSGSYCLIAENSGKAVGYLVASPKNISYRKSRCFEIQNMGVIPDYRSRGIGSMLIQKCLAWAKKKSYQKVYVSSYSRNKKAIKFYKKNGFGEIDLGLELDL
jgi:ribosomal protein S18 acetylase RimI-like enzyme